MKILSVSDSIETRLYDGLDIDEFPGIELILSCGDLPPEYLTYLAKGFNVPLYYVSGNHDIRYLEKPPDGCENLDGRVVRFRGLNFLGLEGSRWYNGGPFQYTEEQMRQKVRNLRRDFKRLGGVDVIITHAPPRFVHDEEDQCHKGFRVFRWLIDKYSPAYFVHGHIHSFFNDPSERMTLIGNTQVVNSYGYTILEINDKRMAGKDRPGS
ncbi:MAG: metallophosphoesterase family protein [Deltaproteobacteria bacterium]|nr:metallophosphoesterase family protein [Deltaproteobacteria bacterium]